jgi:hypothetical protein
MPRTYKPKNSTIPAKFQVNFITALDQRTDIAKALRRSYEYIIADLGGAEQVGHVKNALIQRFCWLEKILEDLETGMATGALSKSDVIAKWIQAVNSLSGLAKVLGIERSKAKSAWNVIDLEEAPNES